MNENWIQYLNFEESVHMTMLIFHNVPTIIFVIITNYIKIITVINFYYTKLHY